MKIINLTTFTIILFFLNAFIVKAEEQPYITTQTPLKLFSTQDGEK